MSERRTGDGDERMDAIDRRVVGALARVPTVDIPAGFSARVARQLPARRAVAATPAGYGVMAARIGMAVLLVAIVAVAMHSAGHSVFGVTLEWILCAQLVGLSLWLCDLSSLIAPER